MGAILYEIVTGKKPHSAGSVAACLLAAAGNKIQPTEKSGELIDIALRAMASDPNDRYPTVGDLQEAYRQYCSHAESISLSARAEDDLRHVAAGQEYEVLCPRPLSVSRRPSQLWDGNARARRGLGEANLAYAGVALKNGDFDLGAKLLDPADAAHVAAA